jgi:phosphatidylserine/phosphatidylglycerophosphate/cardiolipin synthase-like enzyme
MPLHAMLLLRRSHSTQRLLPRSIVIKGSQTTVLSSPSDYLSSILNLICTSQHNITLSALYFGTGEPERQVVDAIKGALSDEKRPNLTCTYILDFSRTTRVPAHDQQKCSLQIFQPLLEMFGDRMKVLLYRMPQHFGIFNSLVPGQLSEILGVYHCKFCLFDENVILTGANLSAEYLTNRQDRYILIEQAADSSRSTDGLAASSDLPHFLKAFVKILEPHCCRATYTAIDSSHSDKQVVTIAEPQTTNLSSLRILESELKNLLQIQNTEEHAERDLSSGTSLRPLVQYSQCGLLDESQHLLDLLFPRIANTLSCSSLRKEDHTGDQKHESPTILPLPSSERITAEVEQIRGPLSRIVIASPYPSFLPLFTSALLSLSTPKRILGQISDTHTHQSGALIDEDNVRGISTQGESSGEISRGKMQKEKENVPEDCSGSCIGEEGSTRGRGSGSDWECKYDLQTSIIDREKNGHNYDTNSGISKDTNSDNNSNISSNSSNSGIETSLKFIVAEERSHGFHKGQGLKNLIPKLHTHALQSVLLCCLKNSESDRKIQGPAGAATATGTEPSDLYGNVSVCQYYRKDWTFHVKGIWIFSRPELPTTLIPSAASSSSYPCTTAKEAVSNGVYSNHAATYIGSSNFGERSSSRDFELGFVLHTTCPSLSSQLSEECSRIEEHSSDISDGLIEFTGRAKEAKWYIPILTKCLRTFL